MFSVWKETNTNTSIKYKYDAANEGNDWAKDLGDLKDNHKKMDNSPQLFSISWLLFQGITQGYLAMKHIVIEEYPTPRI